jgi:hypothetical protein
MAWSDDKCGVKKFSHNVTGIRRFASPDKGFAKQRPGLAKCGWRLAWEPSGDLASRNPVAALRRRSVYRMLSDEETYAQFSYYHGFMPPFLSQ